MARQTENAWAPDGDNRTDAEWLVEMFEFEYCEECGGDVEDHQVVPGPFGLRFAYCLHGERDQ